LRRRFGKVITELADRDEKIYVLVGDIGYRVFDEFREKHPDRFINMGICEQSMIGVSSGMALEGLKPWVYTITPFLIERPFEQVKLDIDQQNVNVKLVGFADYPTLGPSHSELNGQKLMQLFTNIASFLPKDGDETQDMTFKAYDSDGPAFISLKSDPQLSRSITGSGGHGKTG
jgi:transketolase|tara:strand:- start:97 stop:618 length:522 start_codon:yes stop_codon:yes gene_type:complete